MFTLVNVSKVYDSKKKNAVKALEGISYDFPSKGLYFIQGKSGAGKTTLLNILGGIDKPTSGEIYLDGEKIDFSDSVALDNYRAFSVSFLFQDFNLLQEYSVIDNVIIGLKIQGKENAKEKAQNALNSVGMGELADRKISTLSGGQIQRVALARAVARDSKIVLCDEPTGNLDSETSETVFNLIKQLSGERLVIVVTHDGEAAKKYGDEILTIKDGRFVDGEMSLDGTYSPTIGQSPRKFKGERTHGLSFKNTLVLVKDNISKSVFINLAFVIILAAAFTLISAFFSLFRYDKKSAYVSTLKANDQYLMAITKYKDGAYKSYEFGESVTKYGIQGFYKGVSENDIAGLEEKLAGRGYVYPSYFFTKNLQDFSDKKIYTYNKGFQQIAYNFRELIVVNDFNTFNNPVQYGGLPKEDNEVLIYDYMADCLLTHGVLEGDGIASVVGQTLTDRQTGFSMKISGILKSNYIEYYGATSNNDNIRSDFIETYLTGLQSIFGTPTLLKKLQNESEYFSIKNCVLKNVSVKSEAETNYKKYKYISDDGLNFIWKSNDTKTQYGVILSVNEVAEILNIQSSEITAEIAEQFATNYSFYVKHTIADYTIERDYNLNFELIVAGICKESIEEEGVIHKYKDSHYSNGTMLRFYIGFNKSWKVNEEIFNLFWVEEKPQSFYEQNPDYYEEGFYDYMPIGMLLEEADNYLVNVKDMAGIVMYVLVAFAAVSVFTYSIINIRKFEFKTGVLKAMGAKNFTIVFTFITQLLLISLFAFIISLPLSYVFLSSINGQFVKSLSSLLVFFSMKPEAVALSFGFATVGVLLAAAVPLIRLRFTAPASIIKTGKSKL